eukprot:9158912-Pyramimonas_sp.AAC.1
MSHGLWIDDLSQVAKRYRRVIRVRLVACSRETCQLAEKEGLKLADAKEIARRLKMSGFSIMAAAKTPCPGVCIRDVKGA